MRKILMLTLFLFLSNLIFFSCDNENSEIERYKNGYRDPEIIGKWLLIKSNISDHRYEIQLNSIGEWWGEFIFDSGYHQRDFEGYYFTKNNTIYRYLPGSFKESSQKFNFPYQINNDTLKIFYSNEPYIYLRINE
ncbi:hypothetical protein AB4865_02560 [Capnocytophaga sp. ARDL2]|uniref:hypothetical protein n=1 Tax=Capnocytophaga sp. ARDL2 TaxID=3238809 RepID=UPI003558C03B